MALLPGTGCGRVRFAAAKRLILLDGCVSLPPVFWQDRLESRVSEIRFRDRPPRRSSILPGPCDRAFVCLTLLPPAMMVVGEFVVSWLSFS
jgi:hypothetical protein